MHVSAMLTEQHQRWVEIATTALTGEYAVIPVDAGPYPTMDAAGRADYGQPIPRVTWRRGLVIPVETCKGRVTKPPYRHYSAQVHG